VPESLRGRQIILAGGTGGLGAQTAELLLGEGAALVLTYKSNTDRAEKWRGRATVVQADLTHAADRERLLNAAPDLYGTVTFAGDPARLTDPSRFEEVSRQSMDTNYFGPILLAREAAERMKLRGTAGAIVLISTMQAVSLFAGSTAYAAPKAALVHAARILAKEMRSANIRINVVCPGVNAAGMAEVSIASGKYDRYINDGTIPRFGKADDVARAVRFFLEPDNYITGQVLTVDGGLTL
jgi:NAD(P)-dependent dehydrogenase (short-subunit alcohol dehydrogenase family)